MLLLPEQKVEFIPVCIGHPLGDALYRCTPLLDAKAILTEGPFDRCKHTLRALSAIYYGYGRSTYSGKYACEPPLR